MEIFSVEVLTIFPEIFSGFLDTSLVKKAIDRSLLMVTLTDIRDFASPPHQQVDDTPYGGGAGMVMKPEPLALAIEAAKQRAPNARVINLTPAGELFNQAHAEVLSKNSSLILLCGRYEGIDQRVVDLYVDEEISVGDYILMGGEVPAMLMIEATLRLKENVIGNSESVVHESFSSSIGRDSIEAPHYTRPEEFRGKHVPEVLLSGNHKLIAKWRETESKLRSTNKKR